MSTEISYWEPRVMRHSSNENTVQYAIHEVYFDQNDHAVTYTEDALSPRESSVEALTTVLEECLRKADGEIICGDLQHSYPKETIEYWLRQIDQPVIDYL